MLSVTLVTHRKGKSSIDNIRNYGPCSAIGMIFYVKHNDTVYFVMQQQNNKKYKFTDLGGKIDKTDKTVIDAAQREVMEETNGMLFNKLFKPEFNKEFILKPNPKAKEYTLNFNRLLNENKPIFSYKSNSKYLCILIELNIDYIKEDILPNKELTLIPGFGDYEDGDKIKRDIIWININNFSKLLNKKGDDLHVRLQTHEMKSLIDSLKPKHEDLEVICNKFEDLTLISNKCS